MNDDHPNRGRLLAHLDGELGPEARRTVAEHLERCGRCRARLERYRERSSAVSEVAELVDVPEPDMEIPVPGRGGDGASKGGEGAGDVVRIGGFRKSSLLRAAAAVLLLAGGTVAVTSAPLRAFAGDLLEQVSGLFGGDDARPTAEATRDAPARRPAAASIRPRQGRVHVLIRTATSDAPVVRVRFRTRAAAVVEAPGASFGTSPGRLVVDASASDTLTVELPEGISDARVEVNGRTLLRIRGGEVSHDVTPDTMNGDFLYRPGR